MRLASGSVDIVKIWDTATGGRGGVYQYARHTAPSLSVAFSADGLCVASGDYKGQVYICWAVVAHRSGMIPDTPGPAISLALILLYMFRW